MKTKLSFLLLILFCHFAISQQEGYRLDFNNNNWSPGWNHPDLTVTNKNELLKIEGSSIGSGYQNITLDISEIDISLHPFIYAKIKSSSSAQLEFRALDVFEKEANDNIPKITLQDSIVFKWYKVDLTNKFFQSWPEIDTVDSKAINKLSLLINPGGNPNFTGWIEIDEIIIGDSTKTEFLFNQKINKPKVNQVGYCIQCKKRVIIPSSKKVHFEIKTKLGVTAFSGTTTLPKQWSFSNETVSIADFSEFSETGTYRLFVEGLEESEPFKISDTTYDQLLTSSLKSFYFRRASTEIINPFGSMWTRNFGHPDTEVLIHPSAATTIRPALSKISTPKGWYDASDYGKYVVPATITLWQLLSIVEYFPENATIDLNIPESDNNLNDILDECLWEIEWLKSMQDPNDGGVYHKVTTPNFSNNIMPEEATETKYVIQKSSAATYNFASSCAKAYRLYPESIINRDSLIYQAENAWNWCILHPIKKYNQTTHNTLYSPSIKTGDYGVLSNNTNLDDEKLLAATELYLSTGKNSYLEHIILPENLRTPNWSDLEFIAASTVVHAKDKFPITLYNQAKNKILKLADQVLQRQNQSAYQVSIQAFYWNSNATISNEANVLFEALYLTNDTKYLYAASQNIDYLLGKNPLDLCFITGFGSISPQKIHHRISQVDDVDLPIPGFLVNGPHNTYLEECNYLSNLPAMTYLDNYCSSGTNEVAIYVSSALAYSLVAQKKINGQLLNLTPHDVNSIDHNIYPNPNSGSFKVDYTINKWYVIDKNGSYIQKGTGNDIELSKDLEPGVYFIELFTEENLPMIKRFIKD